MRNKLTALMISLVLVTALNTASFALGRGPGRPFGDPGERMMARIVSELGLSRAQKDTCPWQKHWKKRRERPVQGTGNCLTR